MKYKNILIDKDNYNKLEIVKEIYLNHHPYMKKVIISKNKLIYELIKYYIMTEPDYRHIYEENDNDDK